MLPLGDIRLLLIRGSGSPVSRNTRIRQLGGHEIFHHIVADHHALFRLQILCLQNFFVIAHIRLAIILILIGRIKLEIFPAEVRPSESRLSVAIDGKIGLVARIVRSPFRFASSMTCSAIGLYPQDTFTC